MTDGELLTRFLGGRDDDALAALVRRHAPMVWGVCRRMLRTHQDAEDAFQATFLVLVRKAAGVPRRAVANWLFGVARQTAVRLRATAAKRGRRETQVVNMPEPVVAEVRDADLRAVLDEELSRLPDHYRGVLVLCDLGGVTRKEAARRLAIPEGSVASRLARARALLAKRLTQRGVLFSGGSVAAVLTAGSASASAPPALVASTLEAASLLAAGQAAGVVSAKVAALTEGVVRAMFVSKVKGVLAAVLVAALAGGTGLVYTSAAARGDKETPAEKPMGPAAKTAGVDEPLTVRVDPQKLRVRPKVDFEVRLRVINSSQAAHSFQVMSCSWFRQWKASNERITLAEWDCAENDKVTETLQAGRAYEKKLSMRLASGKPGEKVTFRMGFTPVGSKRTVWGNEIVLQVEGEPAANQEKEPAADKVKDKDKEAFTAWGERVGFLQVGLGFPPGERRAYRPGETVTLVVRVRNIDGGEVKFEYLKQFFSENPPTVTDADGKSIPQARLLALGEHEPEEVSLPKGKEIELASVQFDLLPARERGDARTGRFPPLYADAGKVSLQYERVFGNTSSGSIKVNPGWLKLATGKLQLEIKQEKHNPPKAKGDKEKLQGTWRVLVLETEGLRLGEGRPELKEAKVVIAGNTLKFIDPANKENKRGRSTSNSTPRRTPFGSRTTPRRRFRGFTRWTGRRQTVLREGR